MSSIQYRFIEPLDVLFLRGNQLFGDPGSFGESLIPPWPSVAAGAIRSRILADDSVDLAAFANGEKIHPELGTPALPGSFAISAFHLARRGQHGVELLASPPADLYVSLDGNGGKPRLSLLRAAMLHLALTSSFSLSHLPILAQSKREKAASGYWLTQAGWEAYLRGELPSADELVPGSNLWQIDTRVGVGLSSNSRSAEDGKLFSMQAVALSRRGAPSGRKGGKTDKSEYDVGFLVAVAGAKLPTDGLLRLGGDGRAAAIDLPQADFALPVPDYEAICQEGRCRLVLTSPGLFPGGWNLPGAGADNRVAIGDVRARLVSAAVPRAEIVSGWDLAKREPKPAQRVAPSGSVYWLDEMQATPASLRKFVEGGLWSEPCEDPARRAEGFNRFSLARWSKP
jgi:CRISPR-associated protein Cmr3